MLTVLAIIAVNWKLKKGEPGLAKADIATILINRDATQAADTISDDVDVRGVLLTYTGERE